MAKLLVVDDDAAILDALCMLLENSGYEVRTTTKGNETFEKVIRYKPELILLDVLISGSDGRQIAKELKQNDATKNIPIIMISAHPSAARESKELGVEGFLSKPFDSEVLLATIESFLSKRIKK